MESGADVGTQTRDTELSTFVNQAPTMSDIANHRRVERTFRLRDEQ